MHVLLSPLPGPLPRSRHSAPLPRPCMRPVSLACILVVTHCPRISRISSLCHLPHIPLQSYLNVYSYSSHSRPVIASAIVGRRLRFQLYSLGIFTESMCVPAPGNLCRAGVPLRVGILRRRALPASDQISCRLYNFPPRLKSRLFVIARLMFLVVRSCTPLPPHAHYGAVCHIVGHTTACRLNVLSSVLLHHSPLSFLFVFVLFAFFRLCAPPPVTPLR